MSEHARTAALKASQEVFVEATSLVSFNSHGRLLIIGDHSQALACLNSLPNTLSCAILATSAEQTELQKPDTTPVFFSPSDRITLTGHFGEFIVHLDVEAKSVDLAQISGVSHFDLILDLNTPPLLNMEVPPLGYYAPAGDQEKLTAMLEQLPEMIGEFEKAKFFTYNSDICAHGNSGIEGCTRCLDACPTDAIASLGDKIAVDPYYCQGGGSCATACPSGAIIYSYPKPADAINRLRVLLKTYRENGGATPVLLFYDTEAGNDFISTLETPLPGNVIPVQVEEIGSVGMDAWLAAIAFGASSIRLLTPASVSISVINTIDEQLSIAWAILDAMGYPANALLHRIKPAEETVFIGLLTKTQPVTALEPAGFAGNNDKRAMLFNAIDWLHQQAPEQQTVTPLPDRSPFGEIQVNRATCTLCMACVSVCPASALADNTEAPQLSFLEANCVQCGLCERACPENAVSRHPRFNFDRDQRRQSRVLNEEKPFHCIACGAPFTTHSMIDKMTAKLQGHWMFQDEQAFKRLQMCGDCRVRNMFEDESKKLL